MPPNFLNSHKRRQTGCPPLGYIGNSPRFAGRTSYQSLFHPWRAVCEGPGKTQPRRAVSPLNTSSGSSKNKPSTPRRCSTASTLCPTSPSLGYGSSERGAKFSSSTFSLVFSTTTSGIMAFFSTFCLFAVKYCPTVRRIPPPVTRGMMVCTVPLP